MDKALGIYLQIHIDDVAFGYIVINGKRYDHDVVICGDKVLERPKHLSKDKKSIYGHTPLTRKEVENIIEMCRDFDVVIIGKGLYGALPILDEVMTLFRDLGKDVLIELTPKAIEILNNMLSSGKRVLGIIHITC